MLESKNKSQNLLIILSAPSAGGKSSIASSLVQQDEKLKLSISSTTRNKRPGEINEKHYFFKTTEQFTNMINANEFLEYAKIYDCHYGTSKKFITDNLNLGFDILFDIDSCGAYQIMKTKVAKTISIYILPPSIEILENRMRSRSQDSEENIKKRLSLAETEMIEAKNYDYTIINDNFEEAISEIQAIIKKERKKNE